LAEIKQLIVQLEASKKDMPESEQLIKQQILALRRLNAEKRKRTTLTGAEKKRKRSTATSNEDKKGGTYGYPSFREFIMLMLRCGILGNWKRCGERLAFGKRIEYEYGYMKLVVPLKTGEHLTPHQLKALGREDEVIPNDITGLHVAQSRQSVPLD
jgi:hypothetical protein